VTSDGAQARLRELTDFAAPWAMWIAATLRLPDHVEAGATQLEDLAERGGADPDSLRRLLRYLVARGVFAEMDGGYANTDLSRLLVEEFGWRPWLDLDGAPGVWAESWTRLLEGVRTGSPGRDESWYYDELARTGRSRSFDDLMAAQVETNAQQVANEYDWSSVTHTVDVGGGTGVMLRTLLDAHPHLRGTLFDLPQVVAGVEPVERLEIVAGNLFDDPLPQGQAYVLSQIVHGYPDERAAEVLSRCAEAGGRRSAHPARRRHALRPALGRRGELRPLHVHPHRRPTADPRRVQAAGGVGRPRGPVRTAAHYRQLARGDSSLARLLGD
jgi:2,7-dihydroxy-5-methyl-1-naphthoate 7-O-methyltransferase